MKTMDIVGQFVNRSKHPSLFRNCVCTFDLISFSTSEEGSDPFHPLQVPVEPNRARMASDLVKAVARLREVGLIEDGEESMIVTIPGTDQRYAKELRLSDKGKELRGS